MRTNVPKELMDHVMLDCESNGEQGRMILRLTILLVHLVNDF